MRGARYFVAVSLYCSLISAAEKTVTAEKRRVLVIPFDNIQANANFQWMSESMSDNLKVELEKSGRYQVMDVSILKRVNASLDYTNLTAAEATKLAQKLNCEAALIGRFFMAKRASRERIIIQTEGVDTISGKTVFTISESAEAGATLFNTVQNLAEMSANELGEKLPPFNPKNVRRNAKLERLIYHLDHTPIGFLDNFEVTNFKLEPEFDIDIFEYEIHTDLIGHARKREFQYDFLVWGKITKPEVKTEGLTCTSTQQCEIQNDLAIITLSQKRQTYRFKIIHEEPPAQITARGWVTMGYPMLKSFAFANKSNPQSLQSDGLIPLNSLSGLLAVEAGYSPAQYQLPKKIKWSMVAQVYLGRGDFFQTATDYLPKIALGFLSIGGGIRLDRSFYIKNWYAISPVIGVTVHYQTFYKSSLFDAIIGTAVAPEIGLNQTFRIFKEAKWRLMLSTMAGTFIYAQQSLSYIRASLGVEYAM